MVPFNILLTTRLSPLSLSKVTQDGIYARDRKYLHIKFSRVIQNLQCKVVWNRANSLKIVTNSLLQASQSKDLQVYIHLYLQKGSHNPENTRIGPTNYQETMWIYFYLQNIAVYIDTAVYTPQ